MSITIESASHNNAQTTTAGATEFFPVGDALSGLNTTEAVRQLPWRQAGSFGHLYIVVSASTTSLSSTVTLRQNTADTAATLSTGAAATGDFEDATHSVTVAAGDLMDVKCVTSAVGSMSVQAVQTLFTGASVGYHDLNAVAGNSFATASTTWYGSFGGRAVQDTTEAAHQVKVRTAGTLLNLFTYISANARITATTFKSRVNTADGTLAISVGSTATGVFEDTSHSDTLASGDLFNYAITTGTGVQTLTQEAFATGFQTSSGSYPVVCTADAGVTVASASTTLFAKIQGTLGAGSVGAWNTNAESTHQVRAKTPVAVSGLSIHATANARTASTFRLRKNGVDTALTLSVTATTTGYFEDLTDSVAIVASDQLSVALTTGTGTVSSTFTMISSVFTDLSFHPQLVAVPQAIRRAATV